MYVVVYFKSVDKTPSGYHPNENQFSSTNALKEKLVQVTLGASKDLKTMIRVGNGDNTPMCGF